MKTTKRDLLEDLDAIVADLFAKADGYLLSSKAYNCRSTEAIKSGLIKGAAVMRVNAERIQALIAKHRETPRAPARESLPPSEDVEEGTIDVTRMDSTDMDSLGSQ